MKHTLLICMVAGMAIIGACSKGTSTKPTPSPTPIVQWPWTWDNIRLMGKDASDVITSAGYDHSSIHYGRFIYKNDSYTIVVTGASQVQVVQSAATGYDLTGTYDTVHLHSTDGTGKDWTALYGVYRWQGGKEFYQLKLITSTTFFSKTYTDTI